MSVCVKTLIPYHSWKCHQHGKKGFTLGSNFGRNVITAGRETIAIGRKVIIIDRTTIATCLLMQWILIEVITGGPVYLQSRSPGAQVEGPSRQGWPYPGKF